MNSNLLKILICILLLFLYFSFEDFINLKFTVINAEGQIFIQNYGYGIQEDIMNKSTSFITKNTELRLSDNASIELYILNSLLLLFKGNCTFYFPEIQYLKNSGYLNFRLIIHGIYGGNFRFTIANVNNKKSIIKINNIVDNIDISTFNADFIYLSSSPGIYKIIVIKGNIDILVNKNYIKKVEANQMFFHTTYESSYYNIIGIDSSKYINNFTYTTNNILDKVNSKSFNELIQL